jgi:hypothetical protein
MLINLLLLLIGKSADTQKVFGNGNYGTSKIFSTGTMNTNGLFWGNSQNVKIFGMEHWWGNCFKRIAGYISGNGTQKIKLTYGQFDGSTVNDYNINGTGYIDVYKITKAQEGVLSKMSFNPYGLIPIESKGSSTTYYTDSFSITISMLSYPLFSGSCYTSSASGGAFLTVSTKDPNYTVIDTNASVSCKPLAPIEEGE